MKIRVHRQSFRMIIPVVLLLLLSGMSVFAQSPRVDKPRQEVQLGGGMSLIAPGLMEVGAKTKLFLAIADRIELTPAQRKKLEELFFEDQSYRVQREADLDVADAELKRLLTRDSIDLGAVRAKMKEIEGIRTDTDMKRIETLLKAIGVLSHEQHTKVVILVQEMTTAESQQRSPNYQ